MLLNKEPINETSPLDLLNTGKRIKGAHSLKSFGQLKQQFMAPSAEFSPIPFWFWNDELTREELIRQIRDFHSKEVNGFVIHPRMGLPRSIPYLSDEYMELVEAAVVEAAKLEMTVILYDEGMYPSGSACGMVVKQNPEYASRGLQLKEYPCKQEGTYHLAHSLGEKIISVQAVRKLSEREIMPGSVILLEVQDGVVQFNPPDANCWSILVFMEIDSKGTIRGVHPGQDDGQPDAPLAADLLNPDAVQAFISMTHERYYNKLSLFFGTTIIAMFTDEPDLLGRGHIEGLKPWTRDFMAEYGASGGREQDLAALWFEAGEITAHIRDTYETAIRNRMATTYYKALADWCEEHGIALTGHPGGSDDIGLLEHFHIPGQDVVWRYIAPENDKAVTGVHSTMGKCSSDSARHRGKRRNLNESFGVCGIEGGWSLSADNMKWYLDWLFVRGVNMISPHAFYYSIRGERRDERPPDVGPHNIWWSEYAQFSRYIKRMSWLMTDMRNNTEIAVLAGNAYLPWELVKPLYEQQIEFNYLEEDMLIHACEIKAGALVIEGYQYKTLLIDGNRQLSQECLSKLERFVHDGGLVIEMSKENAAPINIGQVRVDNPKEVVNELVNRLDKTIMIEPASAAIRISCVVKDDIHFYVLVNEGETRYEGVIQIRKHGLTEVWHPWTGECEAAWGEQSAEGQRIAVNIERRECLVIAVDSSCEHERYGQPAITVEATVLSEGWHVVEGPFTGELAKLSSWTEWPEMKHYSGSVTYEQIINISRLSNPSRYDLDLGDAHELVHLEVNGQAAGCRMWKPYVFDIGKYLNVGANELRVSVTNSLANDYDDKSFPSGLIGPVRLMIID